MNTVTVILIGTAIVLMLMGSIFYKQLCAKYKGVIGVGGAYVVLIGIMTLCTLIGNIFTRESFKLIELVISIIFAMIGLGYLVYVMIACCDTAMQRIMLPIATIMIALGFCLRFILSLVFKFPVNDNVGKPESPNFPESIIDNQGDTWNLCWSDNEKAEYQCRKTGDRTVIWYTGEINYPNGWRAA